MLTRWRHAGDLLECLHQSYSGSLSRISLFAIKAIAVLAAVDPVICNILRPATQPMPFNIIARSPLCGHWRVASCITVGKSPCVKKPGMSWVLRQKSVAGEPFAEERMMNRPVGDTAAGDSGHLACTSPSHLACFSRSDTLQWRYGPVTRTQSRRGQRCWPLCPRPIYWEVKMEF